MNDENSKDCLGDRMKSYEAAETSSFFDKAGPLIIRVDGRAFSQFTRSMMRPWDGRMARTMLKVAGRLLKETNGSIAYTQSDEITVVVPRVKDDRQQRLFNDRKDKIISVIAGAASSSLQIGLMHEFGRDSDEFLAGRHFDCRAFNVPSETEAANCVLWRYNDATRNGILAIAHQVMKPREMHGKKVPELTEMLVKQGIALSRRPRALLYGTFVKRVPTEMEIDGNKCIRHVTHEWSIPNFREATNRTNIIFDDGIVEPIVAVHGADQQGNMNND